MSLKSAIQKKFQNIFVAVVLTENECNIRCKVVKNGEVVKTFNKVFTIEFSSEILDKNVENYLISLQEEYQFVYIAFLLNSMGQGAISGFSKEFFTKNSVDIQNVTHVTISNLWSTYASFIEIKWAKNLFSEVGLDLIYSPFILLNDFVISQKLKNKPTLYILNSQDFFILAVFDNKKLHFGAFFKTQSDTSFSHSSEVNDWESEQKEENIATLGELSEMGQEEDNDEMSELSELGDIDDLQSVDSFSDFDDTKTIGRFKGLDEVRDEDTNLELYGRDLLVYKYLKSSLEEYYHNPIYLSEFIEEIIIFDGYEVSSELIHQLEDELMMDVEIHKVDLVDRMCDIAIKEVFQ
ncbi:MAG: hypothetical protein J0647_02280 [Campylobacteraceae bacterium]|nr:hypothetical protein [Campylobacteraceae bacterium]